MAAMRAGVGKRSNLARGFAVAAVTLTTGARAPAGVAWRPLPAGTRAIYEIALDEQRDAPEWPLHIHHVVTLVERRGEARGGLRERYEVRTEPAVGTPALEGATLAVVVRERARDADPRAVRVREVQTLRSRGAEEKIRTREREGRGKTP
jgi:hypothetical protein